MSNQVQCPNCGGFKKDQRKDLQDPTTGKWITSGCGTWIFQFMISIAVYGVLGPLTKNFTVTIIVSCLVFLSLYFWSERKRSQAKARANVVYNYECKLCGYKWAWQEGQPLPIVNVRPDLIAKGEQRIEEERMRRDPRLR